MALLSGKSRKWILFIGSTVTLTPIVLWLTVGLYLDITTKPLYDWDDVFTYYPSRELLFHADEEIRRRAVDNLTRHGLALSEKNTPYLVRFIALNHASAEELGMLDEAFVKLNPRSNLFLEMRIVEQFCQLHRSAAEPGPRMLLKWLVHLNQEYAEHISDAELDCEAMWEIYESSLSEYVS